MRTLWANPGGDKTLTIDCDWHIHSRHSPCGKPEATLESIRSGMRRAGITRGGVTDHLHCELNVPALEAARREYDALDGRDEFHFGLEVSCLREYDLKRNRRAGADAHIYGVWDEGPEGPLAVYLPDELCERLGVEYVIGGAHWPLGAPLEREAVIRSYHRQNMFLAQHPSVDIVAHPWWWMGAWKDEDGKYRTLPWLDDFNHVPRSMHDEFEAAIRENGKFVEINAGAILLNDSYPPSFRGQYLEYLVMLKEAGVRFATGSDSHDAGYNGKLRRIEADLDALGLTSANLWQGPAADAPRQ
jgi:histidinol phosphatase-like PHP family hydrolase